MKVRVWKDERWPDYGLSDGDGDAFEFDVSEEFYQRYKNVNEQYDALQTELSILYSRRYSNATK